MITQPARLNPLKQFSEQFQHNRRLQLYERAMEATNCGIVITDVNRSDCPIIYCNQAFEKMTGYSQEETIGQNCRFLQGPDTDRAALDKISQAIKAEEECQVVLKNYRKDGTFFWNELKISPIHDAVGRLTHFIGIQTDITSHIQAETALKEQIAQEQLLGTIANNIRSSLNPEEVLNTAVEQVRLFLQTDRVILYRFQPDWSGVVAVESVSTSRLSILGQNIKDECFGEKYSRLYEQGRVTTIEDIYTSNIQPCHRDLLAQLEVRANLVVPILQTVQNSESVSQNRLWGLLIAHHCESPRRWEESEVKLLQKLSIQLGIAIQQSTLFEQLKNKLAEQTLAEVQLREKAEQLEQALQYLQAYQVQLIQAEKMSGLGQLVAGVAHEINNPVSFIYGNLDHATDYTKELLKLFQLYQKHYPNAAPEIQQHCEDIGLDFIVEDFPKLLASMKMGADRINQIVLSLRNFSRLDEAQKKSVDIHEGIDNTLSILQHRLKATGEHPSIKIIKEYGDLPQIDCYAGQLNQVFMNILSNAIDALRGISHQKDNLPLNVCSFNSIRISTEIRDRQWAVIRIADNGIGIPEEIKERIFDPFFTTKPIGKGTGLGLSISYQIVVDRHGGQLKCVSNPGQGTEFIIEIPLQQTIQQSPSNIGITVPVQVTSKVA